MTEDVHASLKTIQEKRDIAEKTGGLNRVWMAQQVCRSVHIKTHQGKGPYDTRPDWEYLQSLGTVAEGI